MGLNELVSWIHWLCHHLVPPTDQKYSLCIQKVIQGSIADSCITNHHQPSFI